MGISIKRIFAYAEGKKYYEIDFVIPDRHKISPIEVKSSGYKTHKSLDEFCSKFSDRIMNKYLIYTKDYRRENGVEYIPRRQESLSPLNSYISAKESARKCPSILGTS